MKKRNFVLRGFNAFKLAERICGSACSPLQADETAKNAETSLNPSPLTPLPRLEIPLRSRLSSLRCRCRDFGSRLPACQPSGISQGERRNKAFTLAEVLITLVIIGVIGALTVPALIQNTQKQEYVAALKKAYSTLSQAAQAIIAEEGSPKASEGGWAESGAAVFEMFKRYLNNAKACSSGEKGCIPHGMKFLNGADVIDNMDDGWAHRLVLADGMQIFFYFGSGYDCSDSVAGDNNVCCHIDIDINGSKAPNQWGRDIFGFVLKENGVFPMGCNNSSSCSGAGYGCACKVLTEDAVNY